MVIGFIMSLAAIVGSGDVETGTPTVGIFSIIVFPILYAIIGGVSGCLTALLYNLAVRWVGALEIET